MTQNVKALCHVDGISGWDGVSKVAVIVSGHSGDNTIDFSQNSSNGTVTVYVDPASYTLKQDIYNGVKTRLQSSPWNVTFGANDVLHFMD
jgi:hypothetical protein